MENITITNGTDVFSFSNIGELVGFEYPEARLSIEDLAGNQSAVWINSKAGRRRFSFQTIINHTDRINLLKVLRPGNTKTLKFETCDSLELQSTVDVQNVVLPYKQGRQVALIELVAADWRFVGQSESEFVLSAIQVLGGMAIPATVPFNMYGTLAGESDALVNAGSDYAESIFTIDGPMTSCVVTNTTTGESFTIVETLALGDTLVLSSEDKTIIKNGTTSVYSSMTAGDIWRISPGTSEITFSSVGAVFETALTINWRNSYIGI